MRRDNQDLEIQKYGWVFVDHTESGIVAHLIAQVLERLFLFDVDE